MAARVPVIAADAGGPGELISHDVDGVLYPIGDQSALAEAMRRLAADPQGRQRLIANSYGDSFVKRGAPDARG